MPRARRSNETTSTTTTSPETSDTKPPFDPMELRSRMVGPLKAVVEGCPDQKKNDLVLHLLLLVWEKVSFLDIEVRKQSPADGTVTNAAARFSS